MQISTRRRSPSSSGGLCFSRLAQLQCLATARELSSNRERIFLSLLRAVTLLLTAESLSSISNDSSVIPPVSIDTNSSSMSPSTHSNDTLLVLLSLSVTNVQQYPNDIQTDNKTEQRERIKPFHALWKW